MADHPPGITNKLPVARHTQTDKHMDTTRTRLYGPLYAVLPRRL